jgi:16S rRNA processing protein RimM
MLLGLESAEMPADAVEVGRIADAWGIKGWFKILPYSADPKALFSSKNWFLMPAEKGSITFSGTLRIAASEVKFHSGSVVACVKGCSDRSSAESLRGARIFVSRGSFPSVAEDEYYWIDLIGLAVVNREKVELGVVRELLSTGAQTVLVMDYFEDGKSMERMIPFVSVYVDKVDLPSKQILVDWQPDF